MTAVGPIIVQRIYFKCPTCGLGGYHIDERIGIDGFLSKQARQLICFVATDRSFELTEELLGRLCGWSVSEELIRLTCYREAARMEHWFDHSDQAYSKFIAEAGKIEVEIDGTAVNTIEGGREVKMCIFVKREPGQPTTPEHWDDRRLPLPTARMAFATVEPCDDFTNRVADWKDRLVIGNTAMVSVLADGADWIWNLSRDVFPGATEILDIYHALKYVTDASNVLYGAGSEAAQQLKEQTQGALLRDGWFGLCEVIMQVTTQNHHTPLAQQSSTQPPLQGTQPAQPTFQETQPAQQETQPAQQETQPAQPVPEETQSVLPQQGTQPGQATQPTLPAPQETQPGQPAFQGTQPTPAFQGTEPEQQGNIQPALGGKSPPGTADRIQAAVDPLTSYFSKHLTRLNYCARIYGGRTIGSGLVEGAAKNMIGRRLKQTKAPWLVPNVDHMARLCCCRYSGAWDVYWQAA